MKPQPETYPITEIFSGGDQSTIKGVTEHYFPSRYSDIRCEVSKTKIDVKNFREMEVDFTFKLIGNPDTVENLYEEENWKYLRTKYVLEDAPTVERLKTPAPVMALMLNKYLHVVGAELTIKGAKETVVVHTGADLLILPNSYPPLTELPTDSGYVYYNKKAAVIYANFRVNEEYHLRLKLEANAASFEFAPLFPYPHVEFQSIDTNTSSEYDIEVGASIAHPTIADTFPDWYEHHLRKLKTHDPQERPLFRPAIPERGTFPLFSIQEIAQRNIQTEEELKRTMEQLFVDISSGIKLEEYKTLRFGFIIVIPPDKDTDIIVRTIQRPLPTRIYEQMQSLPNYRDVLVEYDVFNLSHKRLRLRVETEIQGYTDKVAKSIFLPPLNNDKGQKPRQILHQCPRLQRNVLETIAKPARATMLCKVKNEDTKEILFEETFNIDLLPHDQMVWELKDVRSNHAYKLYDFICAWVNPNDNEGLLDGVRSAAAGHHESKTFGDYEAGNLEDIKKQVKALYEYLGSYGMKYVSQPFTAKNEQASQRVVLPENVLKNKAGNCIDLSVLFASLLEGVGIYSLIFITKDHAFIGWGDKRNLDKMFFLETTMLGYQPFDTAVEQGKKNFTENFMFKGEQPPLMPADMAAHILGNHIVDLQKVRYSGVVSIRR